MARSELGTKRVCPVTGKKFYDLDKDPVVSPYTGQSYPRSAFGVATPARPGRAGAPVVAAEEEVEVEAPGNVEVVSLEEADAEAVGEAPAEDDVEIEEDVAEAEPFLEEEEEAGEDDVTDLIGDVEDDEEV